MSTKANRLFTCLLVVVCISHSVGAQNLTKSPYSVVGVGDLHFPGSAQSYAMGQVGQAIRKPFELNILNPASYSALQQTAFEAGVLYAQGTLANSEGSSKVENASFAYFNLALPISLKHGWGIAAGLQPYSNVGYNLSNTKTYPGYPDYPATTEMQGTGGLSRFYLGTGIKLHKNLSVGVNISYLFGQLGNNQQLVIDTQYHKNNIAEERTRTVGDFDYQFGLQYHKDIGKKYRFTAGGTYNLASKLNAKQAYTVRSLGVGGTPLYTRDTVTIVTDDKGTIDLPWSLKGGVAFERNDRWIITADINYTNWNSFRSFGKNDSLKNSLGFGIGASFVPNSTDYKSYFKRVEYRAGARYDNGNVNINGKNIAIYGVSAGFGLPMGKTSKLNLSFEYFVRGTKSNDLIREDYFRVVLGLTISDKWFVRYKYD